MVQGVSNIPVLVKQEIPDDPAQLAVLVQEQGLQTSSSIYTFRVQGESKL